MDMVRLFIAVEIMQPDVLARITVLQDSLKGTKGLRLVQPNLLHFTLHFLGNTPVTRINDVQTCIETIDTDDFHITLRGCGVFPHNRRPRVLWIGVTSGREMLITLQQQLKTVLQKFEFPVERREYSPHLTLARIKKKDPVNASVVSQFLQQNQDFEAGKMLVAQVIMKESTLTPAGPVYKNIYTKELIHESH